MITTASTGSNCGRVTSLNTRHPPAPSTWAASMVSRGILARPPISTSVRNGIHPQTSAITHTEKARVGLASQLTSASGGINTPKKASNNPNSGLNMKRNETPINAGLIAKGKINKVCTPDRRRPPGTSNIASPSASKVVRPTVTTV